MSYEGRRLFWHLVVSIVVIILVASISFLVAPTAFYVALKLLLGTGVLIFLGVMVTAPWSLPWFLKKLARRNFMVTLVEENTGKWIMQNNRAWRFVTSEAKTDPKRGWNVEEKNHIGSGRLENADGFESGLVEFIDREILPGGMRLIGLNPFVYSIYWYNFRRNELRDAEPLSTEAGLSKSRELGNGKWEASFSQRIDYIFLRDAVYFFEIIGAQTKGAAKDSKSVSISVKAHVVRTVRIVNPYLALFQVHDWLQSTFNYISPSLRNWIANHTYEELLQKPEVGEREHDEFLKYTGFSEEELAKLPTPKPKSVVDYIECTYGVREKRISFIDIIPPDDYLKAVNKRASAEQEKVQIETLALAEGNRITTVALAQAKATRLAARAFKAGGPAAVTARAIEALASTHPVIVGSQPINMLIDAAGGARPLLPAPLSGKGEEGDASEQS